MKKWAKAILVLMVLCTVLIMAVALYANDYYRAVDIDEYMTDNADADADVDVIQIKDGYFFDGPGTENALIFYPGAKVEETAYAPILNSLANQGIDCFLIRMPMKLAFLGLSKADGICDEYSYTHYYLAGHSLGGAMIANYSAEHIEDYSGLFLLAAYPTADLTNASFPVVFIFGENDEVLNREKLEDSFALVPSDYSETVIHGGNHAQFGSYGAQDGDGSATITAKEQWKITVDTILKVINK